MKGHSQQLLDRISMAASADVWASTPANALIDPTLPSPQQLLNLEKWLRHWKAVNAPDVWGSSQFSVRSRCSQRSVK